LTGFNLILFQGKNGIPHSSDYLTIRHMMYGPAPDIDVHVIATNTVLPPDFWSRIAERPTLLFSPDRTDIPSSARGTRIMINPMSKMDEARSFFSAGLPHPMTKLVDLDIKLDEADWGPFTVLKPIALSRGRGVRLVRTRDVRWKHSETWPRDDVRYGRNLLAQQFINPGPYSRSHRVFTVLGRTIYSLVSQSTEKLELPDPSGTDAVDLDVAVQGGGRVLELSYDEDVISLAETIHRKFPQIPALGIDIIREQETRRLFVLEMNSGGGIWHISSDYGLKHQRDHKLDLYGQFNALGTITKALIETTRKLAT
jgi:hypothetical protein